MKVLEQVLQYITTECVPKSEILADTNLFCEGYLDSTAMLELILWIGDTFDVTIQNEDLSPENFGTPRNIVDFVQQRLQTPVELENDAASRIA
jgi:acyl carrier protein